MPHGAKHTGTLIIIVYICADGFGHGDAVTGAAGVGEYMNAIGGLRAVVVEGRLETVHQFPIAGVGAGGNDAGLTGDLNGSPIVLGNYTGDLAGFIGFQLLCRSVIEHLTAVVLHNGQQLVCHPPANAAGANGGVNALVVIIPVVGGGDP